MLALSLVVVLQVSQYVLAAPSPRNGNDCDQLLIKSDDCIRKALLFGEPNARFPQTSAEIDRYCSLGQEYMQCVREYGKCLKPFPRQVFSILIRNLKGLMKETCDTQDGKQEFMAHSRCMTKENLSRVHRLMNKMTIHLNFVHRNTTKEQKIPYMCCSIILGKREMDATVSQMCGSLSGGDKTVEYVNKLYNQAVGEAVDIGCGNKYGSEAACRSIIGDRGWESLSDVISDANYQEQETSFLVPVVGITRELDS